MDMKKFMDAVKEPSRIEKTDAQDMHRFLSIVTEGKNTTTNRLSMAEQMAVQQYTPETKKNITNPVLNVSKDAKPSMIGKYFKAVEEEIAEAQERTKDRAKLIAERVISKMHSASKQRIEEYYNVPATDSKSPIPGHVSGCQCKEVEEGLKDPKDNPCWKGYKPVGTKKKGGRTVPNCVPKEGVTEGTDPNKLAASVTLDGEFKEFDLTPLIAKNNWVGTPKQIINLAEKYLGDFLRKRGSAYSNLELTYKGTTLKANQVGDVDAPDLEFESMQDVTEDWMDDMRAMAHKMAPQDKMRERQAERAAQEKLERQQRIQQDIENLPDLISQYNDMEAEYDSMGGSNWQYADSEQNLSDEERRARNMETSMRQLADRIHTAKTAKNKGLAEGDSGAKYKVRSIGHDAKGDYYISPSTGKKVYKKGVKVGDHENPKTGEHKGVAENKADGINKMFNNLGDPVYANLQRVALLAMQGRQQEAAGRLQTVIKDADPAVQKKITDAVNNIKPVTINGKIADSSRLDKSKQHNDWIINTFIPWVQSLLGKQGVMEGGPKGYDSDGNPLGGGYDEYENNWVVTIDGKTWKTFDDERQAYKAAAAIERKYGKKTRVYKN